MKGTGAKRNVCPGSCVSTGATFPVAPVESAPMTVAASNGKNKPLFRTCYYYYYYIIRAHRKHAVYRCGLLLCMWSGLCVCWSQPRAVQKRMNPMSCRRLLECGLGWALEPCIKWRPGTRPDPPMGRSNFLQEGIHISWSTVKHRELYPA